MALRQHGDGGSICYKWWEYLGLLPGSKGKPQKTDPPTAETRSERACAPAPRTTPRTPTIRELSLLLGTCGGISVFMPNYVFCSRAKINAAFLGVLFGFGIYVFDSRRNAAAKKHG